MILLELFSWWYGQGWRKVAHNLSHRIDKVSYAFSIPLLTRTLIAPWRRIVATPGAGLSAYARALVDNLVSRCVGFTLRIGVLVAALVIIGFVTIVSIVELVLWPIIPFAPIIFVLLGAKNL